MKVTIRNYQAADKEQCRSLWRELVEWHREIYQDSTIGGEHPEDYFDKHLALVGPEKLWVAAQGSKIVGLIGLIVKEHEAEIEPIVVSKDYRGRGMGRQLVETVISQARKMGIKCLDVSPVARNVQTIGFFHKLGFVNIGRIELFMDFTNRTWRSGLELHGHDFNF